MKTHLFSIIVPAYNAQDSILSCLSSVLDQDFGDYELIVVDDGSKDSTAEKVKSLASDKIKFFHKTNGGASSARNYGIKKASGDWVLFLDADDTIVKGSLKKLGVILSRNDADFVITPVESVTPELKSIQFAKEEAMPIEKTDVIDSIIFNRINSPLYIPRCPGGKIIKRKLIEKNKITFDERLKIFEDGIFNIFAAYHSGKILFLNTNIYNYNKNNPDSQSNTFYPNIASDNLIIYKTIKDLLNEMGHNSPSFSYLCLELFYNSSFASTRKTITTKQKIAAIKVLEEEYAKEFFGKIELKNAYKTLRVVYVLCRMKSYRLLLAFYNKLFKSLKHRNKI